jgi:hypothetical protein
VSCLSVANLEVAGQQSIAPDHNENRHVESLGEESNPWNVRNSICQQVVLRLCALQLIYGARLSRLGSANALKEHGITKETGQVPFAPRYKSHYHEEHG